MDVVKNLHMRNCDPTSSIALATPQIWRQTKPIALPLAHARGVNTEKLELLAMSDGNSPPDCEVQTGSTSVVSSSNARCLGVIWTYNLSPKESIESNIKKACRALGSLGISHGKQNPLTASEIFEVCVLPVCLYGCENWLLTDPLLQLLEAEMGKKRCLVCLNISEGIE